VISSPLLAVVVVLLAVGDARVHEGLDPSQVPAPKQQRASTKIGVKAAFPARPQLDAVAVPGELRGRNMRSLFLLHDATAYVVIRIDAHDLRTASADVVLEELGKGFAESITAESDATITGARPALLGSEAAREFSIRGKKQPIRGVARIALHGRYCFFALALGRDRSDDRPFLDFLDSVRFDDFGDGVALARAALGSPEGQAVVAGLPNVATVGVTVLLFDDRSI
jgi:hypothetical protein